MFGVYEEVQMSGGSGFDRRSFLTTLAAGGALVVGHDLFFSHAAHASELRCCLL
jgi:hypothetical protein